MFGKRLLKKIRALSDVTKADRRAFKAHQERCDTRTREMHERIHKLEREMAALGNFLIVSNNAAERATSEAKARGDSAQRYQSAVKQAEVMLKEAREPRPIDWNPCGEE